MTRFIDMTPKQMVFDSLRNILTILESDEDLNSQRVALSRSLNRIISWEPRLDSTWPPNTIFSEYIVQK